MDNLTFFELRGHKIYVDSNEIVFKDKTYKLTPKEIGVLVMLYQNTGKTISRVDLLDFVWDGTYGNDLGLTQAISRLRQIFNDNPKNPQFIKTVPKKGYQLIRDRENKNLRPTTTSFLKKEYTRLSKFQKNILFLFLFLVVLLLVLYFIDINIRVEPIPR